MRDVCAIVSTLTTFGISRILSTQIPDLCVVCVGVSYSDRVAEVVQGRGVPPPKSLDSGENFKPEHTQFCCELRFVMIYAFFGDLWAKKCLFGSKTVFLWQEVHYYMVYIAYYAELKLQICV